MIRIPILRAGMREEFPDANLALDEPNGLLAAGGDLSPDRLLDAYRHGIFPWFSDGEPILWWSPDPRMIFATERIHVATRLRRWLRGCGWTIRADSAFAQVMRACAAPRATQRGTCITPGMLAAYERLHALGHAHSVEAYDADQLGGGIYGVSVGRMFYGESMFSAQTNGSKVALIALCRTLHKWQFPLLDAQVTSPHLLTMGAGDMPRREFLIRVAELSSRSATAGSWREQWPLHHAKDLV